MSILENIIVPILVIIDNMLDYWVSGSTLTNPRGEDLVALLSTIVQNVALFLAEFSTLLASNNIV